MSNPHPLILVVGMHRSGTSLLGSILQALDVALPGPLLPGDTHNPEGYFERSDITALQEELLIDLGRWWPSEAGLQPLPAGWLHSPRSQRAAAWLTRLLAADLPQQQGPWAIKDPRTSLLLPLWRQVAQQLHLPLRLLLAVRDPAEVVVSLLGRDGGPAGMTADRAQGLWLRHHQQLLADGQGLPLQVLAYGRWFSAPQAQIEALAGFCDLDPTATAPLRQALACIQPRHRRSQHSAGSIRLQPQVRRWQQHLEQAAATGQADPLRRWAQRQPQPRAAGAAPPHPWSRALAALGSSDPASQISGLQHWQQHGIPAISLEHLAALGQAGLPGSDPSAADGGPLPAAPRLWLLGASSSSWLSHCWLQALPWAAAEPAAQLQNEGTAVEGRAIDAALHLQPLACTAAQPGLLLQLVAVPRVFDPCPEQVRLLRLLGVNAEILALPAAPSWLQRPGDAAAATCQLGLPNPSVLAARPTLQALALGQSPHPGWLQPPPGVLQLPCFPPEPALDPEQARLLASWIAQCQKLGLPLVRLQPSAEELRTSLWSGLAIPCFSAAISPAELLAELAWWQAGKTAPEAVHTPQPASTSLWSHANGQAPEAAICISSFNYASRIPAALESCRGQTLAALELVVVDDGSSDASTATIRAWLEQHGRRFCRAQLLLHARNSGLAAARNSAFAAATAPWCFVLDADNQLEPRAVEHCLALALASPASTAVVHPLIRIAADNGSSQELVGGGHAWHREQFLAGNRVDAMALVRRSAWQAVGGYSHIPGGWEDFDFWCKLISTEMHGVLCPEVLATYQRHDDSMLQSQTNTHLRRLSRLLQQRHPWLQLPMAAADS